jgi:hypothetical protein
MKVVLNLATLAVIVATGWSFIGAPGLKKDGDNFQGVPAGERVLIIHNLASDGIAPPPFVAIPTPTPLPAPVPDAPVFASMLAGITTHYGIGFEGQQMGCPNSGLYHTWDTTIAAVRDDGPWRCGQRFTVEGPAGSVDVVRQDSCPGCGYAHIDMSEAGQIAACGYLGRCAVTIYVWRD